MASAERDVTVGGRTSPAQALAAGLVDECHLFLSPGRRRRRHRRLPDGVRLDLELLDERRFAQRRRAPALPDPVLMPVRAAHIGRPADVAAADLGAPWAVARGLAPSLEG